MTKYLRSFSHREAIECIKNLNDLRGCRFMVMYDETQICLYDKTISKFVVTCVNPAKMFNQFYNEVQQFYSDIHKCTLFNAFEHCKPSDHWSYKRLSRIYNEKQLKHLLYGKE